MPASVRVQSGILALAMGLAMLPSLAAAQDGQARDRQEQNGRTHNSRAQNGRAQNGQAGDEGADQVLAVADEAVALTDADARFHAVAVRTPSAPVIDGRLDDEVWQRARVLDGFVQSTPDEGAPASERTEVRVLYDDDAIYIAAVCWDSAPDEVVATALRRDESHNENDSFLVTLDTYHDHRNGYYFETNALGALFDAQIAGEGGSSRGPRGPDLNEDWDAVWEAAGERTEEGWVVEMAIPFWSLRFEADRMGSWGINFRRSIQRRSEESYWAPIPRQYDATRLSLSGMLSGLQGVGRPRNLQIKPFAIGAFNQVPTGALDAAGGRLHENDWLGDGGVDVKWGVTPNLTVDLTANTDFSQVEADDERVNLTRFSLFFPEKREFFLENAGLFEFGSGGGPRGGGGGGFGGGGSVVGFHSRRIGISEDNTEVPLYGGARLTGKIGSWSIGGLSMQSESTPELPSNNFSVFRLRRDLASRSSVGVLFTNRQANGDDYNRQVGFDGRWAVNPQTTVDGWWMQTATPGLDGDDWAGQMRLDWGTPLWQVSGGLIEIGENFNPEMGFVNRTGVRTASANLHWTPYFPDTDWLRNLSPHMTMNYTTDRDGRLLSRYVHFDWDLWLKRGDKLSVEHNRNFEQLDFPFEISRGVVILPGAYHFSQIKLEAQSDNSRMLSGRLNFTIGDFWSGEATELLLSAGIRPGARFNADIQWTRNDVDLPEGDFITDLVRTRFNVDFNTRLSLAALIQYNSRTDQVLSNVRFNFIHTPGADLFVVYNETRVAEGSDLIDRAVIVKLTHLLRF